LEGRNEGRALFGGRFGGGVKGDKANGIAVGR
jgi:hypothetical protein